MINAVCLVFFLRWGRVESKKCNHHAVKHGTCASYDKSHVMTLPVGGGGARSKTGFYLWYAKMSVVVGVIKWERFEEVFKVLLCIVFLFGKSGE